MSSSNPNWTNQETPAGRPQSADSAATTSDPARNPTPAVPARGAGSVTTSHTAPGRRSPLKVIVLFLLVVLAAGAAWWTWRIFHPTDNGKLKVSGRIEGYETNVGAKIPGKVEFIAVREGEGVKVGQLIVRLSDAEIQAQLRGAYARLEKAIAQKEEAQQQLAIAQSSIKQSELNEKQAIEDAQGKIIQAEANVASSEANLAQAQAQVSQSEADWHLAELRKERYLKLAQRGAVAQDDADQAATNEATTRDTVVARKAALVSNKKQLIAAQGALLQARTMRFNPGIRNAQLLASRFQLTQSAASLKSATHEIESAKAAVDEIKANLTYLNIASPIEGIVTARPVEPGAVVAAGQTVLSLINLNTVYLRAYVPEGDLGRVRVGQHALVYLDSAPNRGLESQVIEIDPEASFTPENIYFREDRVKQVVGIKISIKNPAGFAKPGMPADADIIEE